MDIDRPIYALGITLTLLLARREIVARERMKAELNIKGIEAAKLHELDHLRTRFVANISHEFRTPLTLLIGVLEKYISPAYQPPELAYLVVMHRNANRLLHLVQRKTRHSFRYLALQKPYYLNNRRSVLVLTLLAYYCAVIYRRHFDFCTSIR